MATRYEVRTVVEDGGTADASLSQILARELPDAVIDSAQLRSSNNPGRLLVRQWFDTNDASEAQLAGLDRIRQAVSRAGLGRLAIGDPEVRSSS